MTTFKHQITKIQSLKFEVINKKQNFEFLGNLGDMRLTPRNPPPETKAYIILGVGAIFLGISIIYGTFHPSDYDLRNPKGYENTQITDNRLHSGR